MHAAGCCSLNVVLVTLHATVQEMAVYEQYIMGMLTNFDSGLPLDRIHNMLKMFCSTPPYDRTADQLAAFLASLVAADKVALEGALYKKLASAA